MPTIDECKSTLFKLAVKFGVSPDSISSKLLSKTDKRDMLNGDLKLEALEKHVQTWKDMGMPDLNSPK